MKKIKISFILNIIIVVLVIFASIAMFAGARFTGDDLVLENRSFNMFKYFTVDSNILVGVTSLILAVFEYKLLYKNSKKTPKWVYIFKQVGTTGVTLTFLVTLFFLAPTINTGFLSLYQNSNLFFHLIIPILSFVSYVFFEKYNNKYSYAFIGISPMALYSIFYITNVLIHADGLKVDIKYDFYNFLHGDLASAIYTFPIILIVTYIISLGIIHLNNILLKK